MRRKFQIGLLVFGLLLLGIRLARYLEPSTWNAQHRVEVMCELAPNAPGHLPAKRALSWVQSQTHERMEGSLFSADEDPFWEMDSVPLERQAEYFEAVLSERGYAAEDCQRLLALVTESVADTQREQARAQIAEQAREAAPEAVEAEKPPEPPTYEGLQWFVPDAPADPAATALREALDEHRDELDACVVAWDRSEWFRGRRYAMHFTLRAAGGIRDLRYTTNDDHPHKGSSKFKRCAYAAASKWKLPPSKGGGKVQVNFAYESKPVGAQ